MLMARESSVHCLFCDGFENKGGRIGALGLQTPPDLDALLMAFQLTKDTVTVFTNGNAASNGEVQRLYRIAAARGVTFDHRAIHSVSEIPDAVGVQLNFQDGSHEHVRMLLSTPPSVNRAANLISALRLENPAGAGAHVISKTPMGETSLRGCFVAGDTSTPAKIIHVAMASGKHINQAPSGTRYPRLQAANRTIITGSLAGIGAAKQLAQDDGLEADHTASTESQGKL